MNFKVIEVVGSNSENCGQKLQENLQRILLDYKINENKNIMKISYMTQSSFVEDNKPHTVLTLAYEIKPVGRVVI